MVFVEILYCAQTSVEIERAIIRILILHEEPRRISHFLRSPKSFSRNAFCQFGTIRVAKSCGVH